MNLASVYRSCRYEFGVELRRLAYTRPGGHEDPLVQLSERMIRCANKDGAEQQQR